MMKVSIRITRNSATEKNGRKVGGITVKRLGKRADRGHTTGTVVMSNVAFGRSILGDIVEENEVQIAPKSGDLLAVRNWPTARYIGSLGYYIDTDTKQRVTKAKFVYAVGDKIYYW
jgi:hypothetical protein